MLARNGTSLRNRLSRFAASSAAKGVIPVTLPPGQLRLATRSSSTGGSAIRKQIGMVEAALLAATAAAGLESVAITATCLRVRAAAISAQLVIIKSRLIALDHAGVTFRWKDTGSKAATATS
jgi:hypothetical protein